MSAFRLQYWLLLLLLPGEARAQDTRPQLSVASQIARSLRTDGNDARALPILTQAHRRESRALMDEIADTLAEMAITASAADLANARARSIAIGILFQAGKGNTGLASDLPGTPYVGAASRLRRVVDRSAYLEHRQVALKRLSNLDNSPAMLGHLRQYALSASNIAGTAIALLADEKGAGGLAIARELYKSSVVKNDYAKRVLSTRATKYGW